jgi:hypothetical protein
MTTVTKVNENSIRQIVRRGLESGTDRKVIAEQISAAHPGKQGALKAAKHIGWYASKMKAVWNIKTPSSVAETTPALVPIETVIETNDAVTITDLIVDAEPAAPKNKKAERKARQANRVVAQQPTV